MEKYDPFPGCADCGGDDGWTRCQKHADMLGAISEVWYAGTSLSKRSRQAGDERRLDGIEANADGFGEGFGTHGDWSGIRDSSPAAIEAMYEEATK